MVKFSLSVHDRLPPAEAAIVDRGLDDANLLTAPLHEVAAMSCFAKTDDGTVIGGAMGRRWGECCELLQLWVAPLHRRQGLGSQLLVAFEEHARKRGCNRIFLETFSFQTPSLYRSRGYQVEYVRQGYPHGILKYHLAKQLDRANVRQ